MKKRQPTNEGWRGRMRRDALHAKTIHTQEIQAIGRDQRPR